MATSDITAESATRRIGAVLADSARPLKERFRALFTLRNLGGAAAIECIAACFDDESVLLKHELAYCLGQMQDDRAAPHLTAVLADTAQDPMVRHEAAEALGALGVGRELLEKYAVDAAPEVAETCQLALSRLDWLAEDGNAPSSRYHSVDPAPPSSDTNVTRLRDALLDDSLGLFERYRAMFALRDLATEESIEALGAGLRSGSALFRHEVAFVFGQLQDARAVPHLARTLADLAEHEMVRHEAAEALGSIATPECTDLLEKFASDSRRVVRESCEVALDMCEYEHSAEFQYADTLMRVAA